MPKTRALEIALQKTSRPRAAAQFGREGAGRAAVYERQVCRWFEVPSLDDGVSARPEADRPQLLEQVIVRLSREHSTTRYKKIIELLRHKGH